MASVCILLVLGYFQLASAARISTVIDLLQNVRTIDDDVRQQVALSSHGNAEEEFAKFAQWHADVEILQGDKRRQLRIFWFLSCMSYCAIATMLTLLSYRYFGPGLTQKEATAEMIEDQLEATDSSDESELEAMMGAASTTRSNSNKNSIKLGAKSAKEKRLRRAFKTQWLIQSSQEQLGNCAACLLVAEAVFFSLRMVRRYKGFRSIQFATDADKGDYFAANFVEAVACFIAVSLAFTAWRQKKNIFYWPSFLFFCFYVLAANLPPFQLSCSELKYTVDHSDAKPHWFVLQAHEKLDCTLQGITAQQSFLCAILVLPFLVPRQKMLKLFAFSWVLIYVVWSYFYTHFTGEGMILTFLQNVCRIIVLSVAVGVAVVKKFYLEKSQRNIFVNQQRSKDAGNRMFNYYKYMVPEHVIVPMMFNPTAPIAEKVNTVSILFILISDFDQIVQDYAPQELLQFLNEVFSECDAICERHGVTKIETVGEEYVACVGVLPSDIEITKRKGHGELLKNLFAAADEILKIQTSKDIKFRMGVHTGPVVAGVIGQKLPRFRLFGDTINTSARMMQKSINGKLQFGNETYHQLPATVVAKQRGEIEMKGKGLVMTYFFESITDGRTKTVAFAQNGNDEERSSISAKYMKDVDEKAVPTEDHPGSDSDVEESSLQTSNETLKFDDLLEKVAHQRSAEINPGGSLSFINPAAASAFAAAASAFAKTNILSPDQEVEWFKEYHAKRIVKKFGSRLDKQIILFTVLTALEIAFMVYEKCWNVDLPLYGHTLPGWTRMPIFLGLRCSALALILFWRFVVVGSVWLESKPMQVQSCILTTTCLVCVMLFFSYSALGSLRKAKEAETEGRIAPFDQFFNLNFILAFYLLTGQQNLPFKPSLVFGFLAMGLMLFTSLTQGGLNFLFMGKFYACALAFSNSLIAHQDTQSSRERYKAQQHVEETKTKIEGILNTLMPPLVVEQLRRLPPKSPAPSHDYKHATIAQSDLCGFTKLASTRTPEEVVGFMGELFGRFDVLADQFGVYKVETIGDAYIAGCAEKMLTPTNTPANVILFGLAMVDAVNIWAARMGVSVRCRVGVHHGHCVGGIVGNHMQRYHLFGDLMTGLEVLESTAPEGMVQVSPDCKNAVESETDMTTMKFAFTERKENQLQTSKGEIHDYKEVGGRTHLVIAIDSK